MPTRIKYKKGDKLGPYNIEFVEEVDPHIEPSGRKRRKAIFICPYCKKIFSSTIQVIKSGKVQSCGCYRKKYMSITKTNNLTNKKFGKLTVIYKTNKRDSAGRIFWHCLCDCGNEKDIVGYHLLQGDTISCGCIKSKGELKIQQFLKFNNINYIQQFQFKDCINPRTNNKLRFDFYLPNYNYCIEYDGEQHFYVINHFGGEKQFKQQKILDSIKTKYCEKNNIKLIRIPYTGFDNIEEILTKELNL